MESIPCFNYAAFSLEEKYRWMQRGPGGAASINFGDGLAQLAADFTASADKLGENLARRKLGVDWQGHTATEANTALNRAASVVARNAVPGSAGRSSAHQYGDSFSAARNAIGTPPSPGRNSWLGRLADDVFAGTFGIQSDYTKRLAAYRAADQAANDVLVRHENTARAALSAYRGALTGQSAEPTGGPAPGTASGQARSAGAPGSAGAGAVAGGTAGEIGAGGPGGGLSNKLGGGLGGALGAATPAPDGARPPVVGTTTPAGASPGIEPLAPVPSQPGPAARSAPPSPWPEALPPPPTPAPPVETSRGAAARPLAARGQPAARGHPAAEPGWTATPAVRLTEPAVPGRAGPLGPGGLLPLGPAGPGAGGERHREHRTTLFLPDDEPFRVRFDDLTNAVIGPGGKP